MPKSITKPRVEYIAVESSFDCWRVYGINYNDNFVYVTIFSGPQSEERSREYADFKNNQ